MNCSIVTAWEAERKAATKVPPHSHEYYEAVFYSGGGGTGYIGTESYDIKPGYLAVIPSGILHSESHTVNGRVICIGISGDGFSSIQGVFHDCCGEITALAVRIVNEISGQRPEYRRLCELMAEELSILIGRLSRSLQTTERNLGYAAEFIRGNCHERLYLPSVAAQLHISYEYFRHCFAARFGMSPAKYLLAARIELAKRLLADTGLSCTEIAGRCGFFDSSQFAMLFRREVGMTPTEYRRDLLIT